MNPDPLAAATDSIRNLVNRRTNPLGWLEATYLVADGLSTEDATQVLAQLMAQRYLAIYDADLAQLLAQRLGVEAKFSHISLADLQDTALNIIQWKEGRGSSDT